MTDKEGVATLNGNITSVARMLMGRRGMTQTDLANVLDIDKALVSRTFAGTRTWRLEEIGQMAAHFDVSPALFFEDADDLIPSGGLRHKLRTTAGYGYDIDDDELLVAAA